MPLRRLVDVQRAIGIFTLLCAIATNSPTGPPAPYADRSGRWLCATSAHEVESRVCEMTVTYAASFQTDVAGHRQQGVSARTFTPPIRMPLSSRSQSHCRRLSPCKLFRQVANQSCDSSPRCPLNGHLLTQVRFKFSIAV